jgi:hypothetical protein
MWWTQRAGTLPQRPTLNRYDMFIARGTGGQAIFVAPGADLVVVHRGDTDNRRNVAGRAVAMIVEGILAARRGEPRSRPALKPLAPVPLPAQRYIAIAPATAARLVGDYEFAPGAVGRVFMHDDRLFMFMPGEGEAEVFAVAPDEYTVRVVSGVSIVFEPQSGPVTGLTVRMGGRTMRAAKK